jgi:hypothetical protein
MINKMHRGLVKKCYKIIIDIITKMTKAKNKTTKEKRTMKQMS